MQSLSDYFQLHLFGVLAIFFIGGCGGVSSGRSELFPEQILFQHIDMGISKDIVSLSVYYQSEGSISLHNKNEYHTLNINQNHYDLVENGHLLLTTETLQQEIQGDESIGLTFNRLNGSALLSSAILPGFASFNSPLESEVINVSMQNLVIEWQPTSQNIHRLEIKGECFARQHFSVNQGTLTIGQSNLTVEAGSLSRLFEATECDAKISVFQEIIGSVDDNFAGGDFVIELESQIDFYITGLTNSDE